MLHSIWNKVILSVCTWQILILIPFHQGSHLQLVSYRGGSICHKGGEKRFSNSCFFNDLCPNRDTDLLPPILFQRPSLNRTSGGSGELRNYREWSVCTSQVRSVEHEELCTPPHCQLLLKKVSQLCGEAHDSFSEVLYRPLLWMVIIYYDLLLQWHLESSIMGTHCSSCCTNIKKKKDRTYLRKRACNVELLQDVTIGRYFSFLIVSDFAFQEKALYMKC